MGRARAGLLVAALVMLMGTLAPGHANADVKPGGPTHVAILPFDSVAEVEMDEKIIFRLMKDAAEGVKKELPSNYREDMRTEPTNTDQRVACPRVCELNKFARQGATYAIAGEVQHQESFFDVNLLLIDTSTGKTIATTRAATRKQDAIDGSVEDAARQLVKFQIIEEPLRQATYNDAISATGDLTAEQVAVTTKSDLGPIQFCYKQQAERTPGLGTELDLHLVIANDGRVVTVTSTKNTANKAVEDCVVDRAKRWLFPRPEGGNHFAEIDFPTSFGPPAAAPAK